MSGILGAAAGAGDGLEKLLTRMRLEEELHNRGTAQARQQTETERSNRADESYRRDALLESSKVREAAAASTALDRENRDFDRDSTRVLSRINLRPVGADVTPQEYQNETLHGAPAALYNKTDQYQGMSGDDASEPITLSRIKFRGTGNQMNTEQRIADAEERARQANEDRDAARGLAAHREDRLTSYGPPTVSVYNPGTGNNEVATRPSAVGKDAPHPTSQITEGDSQRELLDAIGEINDLGKKTGWSGIGPVASGVGGRIANYLGTDSKVANAFGAGGEQGETLRAKFNSVKSLASFARGGKTFTPTEKAMLEKFLSSADSNPTVAVNHLNEFQREVNRRLKSTQQPQTTPGTVNESDPLGILGK